MNIFNLTASLTLDKSQYEQGIETAKSKGKDFASKTEKDIGVIATSAWLNITKTVIEFGKQVTKVTLDMINYADKYGDLSAKYDISTQSLQEFEYVASQSGATLETVLSTMTMMYNRAKENDEVFSKLGVSVYDVNGNMKTMDTLFWEVKTALDAVDNSGDRSALMLEAFGRNAMSLGEFLRKDTTELQQMAQKAHELGIILEDETIEGAGSFNDKLDELKLRGQSAFAELIMGAEGAEQKFDSFMDELAKIAEEAVPIFANIGLDIGTAMLKGIAKGLGEKLWSQVKFIFGEGWLWGEKTIDNAGEFFSKALFMDEDFFNSSLGDSSIMDSKDMEITERKSTTMEIKLTASGTSAMDEQNIKAIAQELVPIIDKQMGGIL